MVKQNVLIVPYWVRDSLWRSGHKIKDLLDFDTACKILSRNEIAILHYLQFPKHSEKIFGASLGAFAFNLLDHWYDNTNPSRKTDYDKLRKYVDETQCDDEIVARLFGKNLAVTSDEEHVVTEVPGFGIVVTICPNFFVGDKLKTNNIAISREVALLLYKFESMSKILQSPFGGKYIETLLQ